MATRTTKQTAEASTKGTSAPAANAEEQAKAGKEAKKVVAVDEDKQRVTIEAVDPADSGNIARLLLDAADSPEQVRTISAPKGWEVPVDVAKAAGVL